jgi:hypothetical protein
MPSNVEASKESTPPTPPAALAHSRYLVHVALIGTFVAALLVLLLDHQNTTVHIVFGVAFVALVGVHLVQRRRTVRRLATQLTSLALLVKPRGRLAVSDIILALLTVNVFVSGFANLITGRNIPVPLSALGVSFFIGWHTLSALVLLIYLVVHIGRRRARLQNSHIR